LEYLEVHDHHWVYALCLERRPALQNQNPILPIGGIGPGLDYGLLEIPLPGILAFATGWKSYFGQKFLDSWTEYHICSCSS
jgi:hypothetical protein